MSKLSQFIRNKWNVFVLILTRVALCALSLHKLHRIINLKKNSPDNWDIVQVRYIPCHSHRSRIVIVQRARNNAHVCTPLCLLG